MLLRHYPAILVPIGITVLKEDGVANPSYRIIRREVVVALVLVVMLVGLLL